MLKIRLHLQVWHTAVCRTCQHKAAMHKYKVASLFLDHIQEVILYVKTRRPNITILMWDDMLRPMTLETLQGDFIKNFISLYF